MQEARIPPPLLDAPSANNFSLRHLQCNEADYAPEHIRKADTREFLFGYPLPPFQRPAVWTLEQKARFIESIWMGLPIGMYIVNKVTGCGRGHPLHDVIIDGQQRLRAIKSYWEDEFPVFGALWSELSKHEVKRFWMQHFCQGEVWIEDEDKLREAYNRLNYGGTAHTEEQRA